MKDQSLKFSFRNPPVVWRFGSGIGVHGSGGGDVLEMDAVVYIRVARIKLHQICSRVEPYREVLRRLT